MYKFILDESNDDYDVYINLITSLAGRYLSRRPQLIALIKELISDKQLRGQHIVFEKDVGHDIGRADVVATTDVDIIYYAQPLKSEVFSRFAKNRYPQSSSVLTIVIDKDADGNYEVSDTWIGGKHPAFPGDKYETADSKSYWQTHALVQDAQVIQLKTLTKTCPY